MGAIGVQSRSGRSRCHWVRMASTASLGRVPAMGIQPLLFAAPGAVSGALWDTPIVGTVSAQEGSAGVAGGCRVSGAVGGESACGGADMA